MRKIVVTWGPGTALLALATLAGLRRGRGPSLVHDELRRELRHAVASLEAELGLHLACLAWLDRRGLAVLGRASPRSADALVRALHPVELRVDLEALDAALGAEGRGPDGKAHTTLFALRTVLKTLHRGDLCDRLAVRAGTRRVELDAVLREIERRAKRHGFRDDTTVPARFGPKAGATDTPPAPAPPAAEAVPPKPRRSPRRAAPRAVPEGFGSLPDDAVSEGPSPAAPPPDPHAPSDDARFFLREAGLEAWPCDRLLLDRARRAVITRLHPDRAGDHTARDFHRAIKGHAELIALLDLLDPPATAPAAPVATPPKRSVRSTRAKPTTVPPATATAFQEWPPPPRVTVLDDDARYFLRESALTWPASPEALRAAWQGLAARLRRTAPASEAAAAHARAQRGFDSLTRATIPTT